mmetsp:Transcript_70557/g.169047  ORF Transcript_70557/g.169047 Transcript_70557/m.169047 type:complete len:597 (-) Transcript_70557:43-1833(-)
MAAPRSQENSVEGGVEAASSYAAAVAKPTISGRSYQDSLSFLRAAEGTTQVSSDSADKSAISSPPQVKRYLQPRPPHSRSQESLSNWTPTISELSSAQADEQDAGTSLSSVKALQALAGRSALRGPGSPVRCRSVVGIATRFSWTGTQPAEAPEDPPHCDTSSETVLVDGGRASPMSQVAQSPLFAQDGAGVQMCGAQRPHPSSSSSSSGRLHLDAQHFRGIPEGMRSKTSRSLQAGVELEGPAVVQTGMFGSQPPAGEKVPLARHLQASRSVSAGQGHEQDGQASGSNSQPRKMALGPPVHQAATVEPSKSGTFMEKELIEALIEEKVTGLVSLKVAEACKSCEERLEEHLNRRFESECLDVCKRLQVDWTSFKSTLEAAMERPKGPDEMAATTGIAAIETLLQSRCEVVEAKVKECQRTCVEMSSRVAQIETKLQSNVIIPVAPPSLEAAPPGKDTAVTRISFADAAPEHRQRSSYKPEPPTAAPAEKFQAGGRASLSARLSGAAADQVPSPFDSTVSTKTSASSAPRRSSLKPRRQPIEEVPTPAAPRSAREQASWDGGYRCKCGFTCGTRAALEKHLARYVGTAGESEHGPI